MKFGLDDSLLVRIRDVIRGYPYIQKVLIFGSRVMGTQRIDSDIDLCLFGPRLDLAGTAYPLAQDLEDLRLPMAFDLVIHHRIQDSRFQSLIDETGEIFYEASSH